jgi:hypothetical protein
MAEFLQILEHIPKSSNSQKSSSSTPKIKQPTLPSHKLYKFMFYPHSPICASHQASFDFRSTFYLGGYSWKTILNLLHVSIQYLSLSCGCFGLQNQGIPQFCYFPYPWFCEGEMSLIISWQSHTIQLQSVMHFVSPNPAFVRKKEKKNRDYDAVKSIQIQLNTILLTPINFTSDWISYFKKIPSPIHDKNWPHQFLACFKVKGSL